MSSIKTIEIQCSPQRLWEVLTESTFTKQYMFNCAVDSDWQTGSSIEWKGNFNGYEAYQKGEILAIAPQKMIKYSTFDPNYGLEDVPENYIHVTYEIEKHNGGVTLNIHNETFDGNEERKQHISAGWDMVIPKIKEVAES